MSSWAVLLCLAVALTACTSGETPVAEPPPTTDGFVLASPSPSPTTAAEETCDAAYTARAKESRVTLRLHRHLQRLIDGAGLVNFGGDHPYFDASATVAVSADRQTLIRSGVRVHIYPVQRSCAVAQRLRERRSTTVEGVRVTEGRLHGQAAARFTCRKTVYDLTGRRPAHVLRVVQGFTRQLASDCAGA